MMKPLPESIRLFFKDALCTLKKHPLTALLVFIINLLFFLAAALLLKELFAEFWDGEILGRLSRRADLPLPLALIHSLGGKPLLRLTLPLSLYLAFSLAFSLATIVTGPILTRMAGRLQKTKGIQKKHGFFFELKEELIMLAWNINFSAALFITGAALLNGPCIATPLFYLGMPVLYGLYGLSYFCQPRGWTYSRIARESLNHAKAFSGFALAAASGYFLIFLISGGISRTEIPFILLLAAAALWRTFVTAAGTGFAARNFPESPLPVKKKGITKIVETLSLLTALFATATAADAAVKMRDRLGLLECRYSVSGIKATLNVREAGSKMALFIRNPTGRAISIPAVQFRLRINAATVADFSIQKRTIPAKGKHDIPLSGKIRLRDTAKALLNAVKKGEFKIRLRGTCRLPLWFGSIKLHLIRQ